MKENSQQPNGSSSTEESDNNDDDLAARDAAFEASMQADDEATGDEMSLVDAMGASNTDVETNDDTDEEAGEVEADNEEDDAEEQTQETTYNRFDDDSAAEVVGRYIEDVYDMDVLEGLLNVENRRDAVMDISLSEMQEMAPKPVRWMMDNPVEALNLVRSQAVSSIAEIADVDESDVVDPGKDGAWDVRFIDPVESMYVQPSEPMQDRLGDMVAVRGRIANYSDVTTHYERLVFKCASCGSDCTIHQSITGPIDIPDKCPGCENDGARHLTPIDTHKDNETTAQQRVIVEEIISDVDNAGRAEQMVVQQWGRKRCGPYQMGGEADVIGVLRHDFDDELTYLQGYSVLPDDRVGGIEVTDHEHDEIDALLDEYGVMDLAGKAVAPHIIGHEKAKQGVMLAMAATDDGFPPIHTMLVGDKGTGKSEIADEATEIAPRGRFVDAAGTTPAGLLGASKRDETGQRTRSMIEAGTLPKYNGGVVAIDELDQLPWEVNQLKSPLETGTVTIDKDGQSETMRAETSVIGTANPSTESDVFDPTESMREQVPVMGAIGDRFDLAYPFVSDPDNGAKNKQISDAIGDQFVGEASEASEIARVMSKELARKWVHVARETEIDRETHHEANKAEMRRVTETFPENDKVSLSTREKRAVWQIAGALVRLRLGDTVGPEDMNKATRIIVEMKEMWDWDMQGSNDDGDGEENSGSESGNQSGGGDDTHPGGEAESEGVKQTTMDYDGEAMAADLAQTDGGSSVDTEDVSPLAELKPKVVQQIAMSVQSGTSVSAIVTGIDDLDDCEHDRALVEAISADVERYADF